MGTQLFCAMLNSVGQLLSFFFVVVLNFRKTKKKKGWSKCCVKRNNLCQKIVLRWWSQAQDHDSHKLFVSATCCSLLPRTPWIHPTYSLALSFLPNKLHIFLKIIPQYHCCTLMTPLLWRILLSWLFPELFCTFGPVFNWPPRIAKVDLSVKANVKTIYFTTTIDGEDQ